MYFVILLRIDLVSPMAFEFTGDPLAPEGKVENNNLQIYAEATKQLAQEKGLAYIDLLQPAMKLFA